MFGKNELDSLDEFKKAWDEAPERKAEAKAPAKEPAKDTGAVTNMDDFDYGDTAKDTADAKSITAASTPEVDSGASDDAQPAVQTTQAAIVPVAKPAMTFKQRFAAERKAGATTFDWTGKDGKTTKIAVKLLSEMPKAKAAAVQTAKPAVQPVQAGGFPEGESTAAAKPAAQVASAEPVAKQKASTSLLGNFIPPSLVGGDNSTDKKSKREVARIGVNGVSYDAMGNPAGQDAVGSMDADKKESVPAKTVTAAKPKPSTSIFGNFFDSASFGSKSTGDDHRIAANGETVNHKNEPVDTADAIADEMGIDRKNLLPKKPAVQVASK